MARYLRSESSVPDSAVPGARITSTLGFTAYADILASTISTLDTPATVGIFAGWGCGKSYLMNKIKDNLNERSATCSVTKGNIWRCFVMLFRLIFYIPPKAIKAKAGMRFISVYFNAMEYAGSDHLWAGLVTRLVYSVECGIGRLPSAIFRAKSPRLGIEKQSKSSKRKKLTQFQPKKICGILPLWWIVIFAICAIVSFGVWLLVHTFGKRNEAIEEFRQQNNGSEIDELVLTPAIKRNISIGSICLSIPVILVLKHIIPIIFKFIYSHASQIQKLFSRPDFSKELGVMAKIKSEIRHLSQLVRFMELFEQRRILVVIFIDDLDKLPQQTIAPLLQAIKILLSDPNQRFVSILSMDPYSVSDALEMGIQSQFPAINISGHKFLKQMIQVPFTIPAMSCEEKEKLLCILRNSLRLSDADKDSAHDAESTEDVDGEEKPSSKTEGYERREAKSVNRPLLKQQRDSVKKKMHEVIPMTGLKDEMANKPLEEQASVVSACDCVLGEMMNLRILPYINNNLQEMLRLVGTAKVTTRVMFRSLKNDGLSNEEKDLMTIQRITPHQLCAWIVLISQWPYRMTWLIQQVEDRFDAGDPYKETITLKQIYKDTAANFTLVTEWRKLIQLDCDPDDLEEYLNVHTDWLNVSFLLNVIPHTISLDRSLKRIISWTSMERDLKWHRTHTSKPLSLMDVADVISLLESCCRGSTRLKQYSEICVEHNINGLVLLHGEIGELKTCLNMAVGDWTLFCNVLLRLRTAHRFRYL